MKKAHHLIPFLAITFAALQSFRANATLTRPEADTTETMSLVKGARKLPAGDQAIISAYGIDRNGDKKLQPDEITRYEFSLVKGTMSGDRVIFTTRKNGDGFVDVEEQRFAGDKKLSETKITSDYRDAALLCDQVLDKMLTYVENSGTASLLDKIKDFESKKTLEVLPNTMNAYSY